MAVSHGLGGLVYYFLAGSPQSSLTLLFYTKG